MPAKITIFLGSVLFLAGAYFYFAQDASYVKSFRAKYFFYTNDFKSALALAKEAYDENNYNRMAFTIMTQSAQALEWVKFIDEAGEYLLRAQSISEKAAVSPGDKKEIKLMAEVVFGSYALLNEKNQFIDEDLKARAKYIKDQFVKIYSEAALR